MAKVIYKSNNQNDNLLFPHCFDDFIPENDSISVLDAKSGISTSAELKPHIE